MKGWSLFTSQCSGSDPFRHGLEQAEALAAMSTATTSTLGSSWFTAQCSGVYLETRTETGTGTGSQR